MIDRTQNRAFGLVARVASAASVAGLLSLSFTFVHRSILGWGGHPRGQGEPLAWLEHEDVYGPILFSLLFVGLVTRDGKGWALAVLRSGSLSTGLVVAFAILALGAQSDLLHLDHFLIAIGICAFVALMLSPRSRQGALQP